MAANKTWFKVMILACIISDIYHISIFLFLNIQLKNMIAALHSSRPGSTKNFAIDGCNFGWKALQDLFLREVESSYQSVTESKRLEGKPYIQRLLDKT